MAQVEALAEISRDLLQRFQSTPVPSDQYTPYVRNFDHFLRIALEYGELRGIGVVAAAFDDNPYNGPDDKARIIHGVSYWSLPKGNFNGCAHMNPESTPLWRLSREFYKVDDAKPVLHTGGIEGGWLFAAFQEDYPTLDDFKRGLEDPKGREKFQMLPGIAPTEFWGITSIN